MKVASVNFSNQYQNKKSNVNFGLNCKPASEIVSLAHFVQYGEGTFDFKKALVKSDLQSICMEMADIIGPVKAKLEHMLSLKSQNVVRFYDSTLGASGGNVLQDKAKGSIEVIMPDITTGFVESVKYFEDDHNLVYKAFYRGKEKVNGALIRFRTKPDSDDFISRTEVKV